MNMVSYSSAGSWRIVTKLSGMLGATVRVGKGCAPTADELG
jgi:hypothetical protein